MTSWQNRLFPAEPRLLPGHRWLNISLRCAHLVGIAGIGGGFLFAVPEAYWQPFWQLTLASGGLLMLLYLWSSAAWLLQLRGQAIVLKLLLLLLAQAVPGWRAGLFLLVIVISGVIAHAPAKVRGLRWTGGRHKADSETLSP